MAAEPPPGARVYVVAFAAGDELGYVALDSDGAPVADRRLVKDAVSLAALAERAEEVSGATAADELVERFGEAAAVLRGSATRTRPPPPTPWSPPRRAPGRRRGRAAGGDAAVPRPDGRAARPSWRAALDAFVAARRAAARGRASGTVSPGRTPREVAWTALAAAARAGDPANFAQAMTAASGAVDALVADVLDHYRAELDEA